MFRLCLVGLLVSLATSKGQVSKELACYTRVLAQLGLDSQTPSSEGHQPLMAQDGGEDKEGEPENNLRLVSYINALFLRFDSLSSDLKKKLEACPKEALKKTLSRCNEKYAPQSCVQLSPVSFGLKCPDDYTQNSSFFCYRKCPKGFEELIFACKKPIAIVQNPFTSAEECAKSSGPCLSIKDTLYFPVCPPFSKRVLTNVCLFSCPEGIIDNNGICFKRLKLAIRHPVILNYHDFLV